MKCPISPCASQEAERTRVGRVVSYTRCVIGATIELRTAVVGASLPHVFKLQSV
jgi:hypothetical protein